MKKYRITKITVKTREIVSARKSSTDENQFPVCPLCHTTLNDSLSTLEKKTEETRSEKRTLFLAPKEVSENDK